MNTILNLSRRDFLKASGGLALGFHLPQALAQAGPGRMVGADPEEWRKRLGVQRVLGLGSHKTAWTWLHKLRRAMVL
jgi:hypothetical protein